MKVIGTVPFWRAWLCLISLAVLVGGAQTVHAQDPFASGWTLQPEMSRLNFQSVKQQSIVEASSFAALEGNISSSGATQVRVLLDSVDTQIDLRNVRMRFLFFETFNHPQATITTQLDAALLQDLTDVRRKTLPLSYTLDLHGVRKSLSADVAITLMTPDLVSVSSTAPIALSVEDFNLMEGLGKLQDAASVEIVPAGIVSFDFVFARNSTTAQTAPSQTTTGNAASVALEDAGDFDREACKGRFEILSRTGNIYFNSGSSRLDSKSEPLLNALANIFARCPNMVVEVGGHTDSVGTDGANQRLSELRAGSVRRYLIGKDVEAAAVVSKGYGESTPIATNDTEEGRIKNRRIEFKVIGN